MDPLSPDQMIPALSGQQNQLNPSYLQADAMTKALLGQPSNPLVLDKPLPYSPTGSTILSPAERDKLDISRGAYATPYEPTWRDKIGSFFMGSNPGQVSPERRRMVEGLFGSTGLGTTGPSLSDFTPLGWGLNAQEAAHSGNYAEAALGVLPGAKGVKMAEEAAGPFYSSLSRAIQGAKMEKATPEQWMGYLKNQPGVKAEEMNWVGLGDNPRLAPDFGNGPISKQDLHDWVNAHNVQLKDVVKGGEPKINPSDFHIEPTQRGRVQLFHTPSGEMVDDFKNQEAAQNWLQSGNHKDFLNYMETIQQTGAAQSSPKYSEYQLPGGTNYQERLLTLPPGDPLTTKVVSHPEGGFALQTPDGGYVTSDGQGVGNPFPVGHTVTWPNEQMAREAGGPVYKNPIFESSHWDEPNVLAHVRYNDRDVGGKKSLFVEEMQSDWHQQGRGEGYKLKTEVKDPSKWTAEPVTNGYGGTPERPVWRVKGENGEEIGMDHTASNAQDAIQSFANTTSAAKPVGVPDAPFKKSWPDLTLKRMIHHAATNGYDSLSWTPGEVQEARYPGSKHQWFYDRDLVNKANDIGKKYGAKVEQQVSSIVKPGLDPKAAENWLYDRNYDINAADDKFTPEHTLAAKWLMEHKLKENPNLIDDSAGSSPPPMWSYTPQETLKEAKKLGFKIPDDTYQSIHVLPLTPQLKEAAKKGFPMFAAGGMSAGAANSGDQRDENARMLGLLSK